SPQHGRTCAKAPGRVWAPAFAGAQLDSATSLSQLAVLAAAAVGGGVHDRFVALRLAGDAGADAGEGFAALPGDRLAAIVAILGALPVRGERAGAQDRVLHRVVDL